MTSGSNVLATNFDIIAAADGPRKVATITGSVEHEDDTIKGPLAISFIEQVGNAKFNTVEIKSATGQTVVAFSASELADNYPETGTQIPEITEAPFWKDPSRSIKDRAADLIRRMSLKEKVEQLLGGQRSAPAISRLGLVSYNYWNEALHGVANNGIATVFPEPIGGASSWNPSLFHAQGNVIGIEGRAKYNDYANKHEGNSKWASGLTFWTPNINIFRDPRWGRGQETYGEDPFLTSEIGIEFVKGIQGDDPKYMLSMACAKHFAVHSGPDAERSRFDAHPSDRDLYETYLPQFERVVREGKVAGVMGAYNSLNGIPCCASSFLLDDLLRKQWGFEGYVVSDCDSIRFIWSDHHYVPTSEEAAALAIKAGCNLCCGTDYNSLVRAVQKGLVTEKEIDNALYYTLWTRFRLGLFDPVDANPYNKIGIEQNDTQEHRNLALKVAQQSLVLLKNNGILPLDRTKIKNIAVIGPTADSVPMLQGNYNGTASHPVTILKGITNLLGSNVVVTYAQGCPISTPNTGGRSMGGLAARGGSATPYQLAQLQAAALSNAANADVIIYVGGITASQEGETRDRADIELPAVQEGLLKTLHGVGKPVVMINSSGSPMALTWEDQNLSAILQAWYPGEEGGTAVAQLLFGDVNPSGHLPITFYRATADLPSMSDYSMSNRTYRYYTGKPLYAFGHGLSYTTFDIENGKLASNKISANDTVKVSFTVKNTGKREGDEVAQVYFRHVKSSVLQPKQALCGFERVSVKKGGSTKVTVEVPASRFRYWDTEKKQYVVELGDYEILVGSASDDIRFTLPLTIAAK